MCRVRKGRRPLSSLDVCASLKHNSRASRLCVHPRFRNSPRIACLTFIIRVYHRWQNPFDGLGVRREVTQESIVKEAEHFLAFLLQIEIVNRPEWAAQRRAARSYAKKRALVPPMVGPNKGSAGPQHFAQRHASLDAVQGQTDYQARISDWSIRGEPTRVREKPESLLEIPLLVVRLARLIWPEARAEVGGALHDYCERKHLPLPFGLGISDDDRLSLDTPDGRRAMGAVEKKLKRRIRELKRRVSQWTPTHYESSVWTWYRYFLVRKSREPLPELYFCYPPCEPLAGTTGTPLWEQDGFPVRSCAWCGIGPREGKRLCRMPANFQPRDAALIHALCSGNTGRLR
jgi:hypothetical protein